MPAYELPKMFGEDDLQTLRAVAAAYCGATSLQTIFPRATEKQRKSYSAFIHDKTDLDFRRNRTEVSEVYAAVLSRVDDAKLAHVARPLQPLIAKLQRTNDAHGIADAAPLTHRIFGCSPDTTRDDRLMLPGVYAAYRQIEALDGTTMIMRDALIVQQAGSDTDPYLTFEMVYAQPDPQPLDGRPVSQLISGFLLPRRRNVHFLGRDESLEAPLHIIADRPLRKARLFTGLMTRIGVNGAAMAVRILFVRREHMSDPPARLYQHLAKEIGPLPADAELPPELARYRWAIDNADARAVLHQADLTRWPTEFESRAALQPRRQIDHVSA